MKKLRFLLAVGAGLLWPLSALAADGDPCSTAATDYDTITRGRLVPIWCVALCDNLTTNTDCTAFDLGSTTGVGGIPDVIAFELHEVDINASGGAGDCTAGTVTINTTSDAGLTTASENAFDLGSTTAVAIAGTTKILLDTKAGPTGRYILATSSNLDANCTDDGVDILMIGYEEKKQ